MTLYETINNDITNAMKQSDKFTLSVLRMLKSAMQMAKKNQQDELSDEEVINILRKQIKQRKESLIEFEKYNRQDLVQNLKEELVLLNKYLPKELEDLEIEKIINEVFAELNPVGIKDMGKVMKAVNEKVCGKADMGKVSIMIKTRLN